jgi:A/G-specific adenine glycosylase
LSKLAELILDWYALNSREFPWRVHSDPYAIWVSEIMLQQTRVETVIPYFLKWMQTFPTVSGLAHASESDVLSVWEGLGYYSRARNLRVSAQKIMEEHGGKLPDNLKDLIKLPGIGRYTAGAIASIAFNKDITTLDGNIRRVFARLFDVEEIVNSPAGEEKIWDLLQNELPKGKAGDFNQALMDLGATICTPQSPDCPICPLLGICLARSKGIEEQRPILKNKPVQPQFTSICAIIKKNDSFLLLRRPSKGLLGGLWEFPNDRIVSEGDEFETQQIQLLSSQYGMEVKILEKRAIIKHAYTHFRVILHAYSCAWVADIAELPGTCSWVTRNKLLNYPMGKIARKISRMIIEDGS